MLKAVALETLVFLKRLFPQLIWEKSKKKKSINSEADISILTK